MTYDDNKAALFAVFDGHGKNWKIKVNFFYYSHLHTIFFSGGAEVAKYAAEHFPDFLKNMDAYKKGEFEQALSSAFLEFDAKLITGNDNDLSDI